MTLTEEQMMRMMGEIPPEKELLIATKLEECLLIAEKHFNRQLETPAMRYDLRGHTAGQAIRGKEIRLNIDLIYSDHFEDILNRTLPHEIAHIIQRQIWPTSQSHGPEWASVMQLFGLPAVRCHNYKTTAVRKKSKPFIYYCACGEHPVTATLHRRMMKGNFYRCGKCRQRLRKES